MFRKLFVGLALSLGCMVAMAETASIPVDGLTAAQVAELKAMAARAVADAVKPAATPEVLSIAATWGNQAAQAAEGFAKALGIAAKELGVTVNDFLQTDAGKLTAILIIWKVAGASLVKMMYGTVFITVGLTLARALYVKLFQNGYKEVTYSYLFGTFTGTKQVRVTKSFKDLNNEGEWLVLWMIVFIVIGSLAIGSVFF